MSRRTDGPGAIQPSPRPPSGAADARSGERYLLVLIGRPGSGKSSAAKALTDLDPVRLIRVSHLLKREAKQGTSEGREVRRRMEWGELVGTELVASALEAELARVEAPIAVVDGFPRQEDQIDPLFRVARGSGRELSLLVVLALPPSIAEKRLTGRRVCSGCGRVYNIHYDPPPEDACEDCGGELERREDDRPEVVRTRQERFERVTKPVIRWFSENRPGQVRCVRAVGSPEEVRRDLLELVRRRHPTILEGQVGAPRDPEA